MGGTGAFTVIRTSRPRIASPCCPCFMYNPSGCIRPSNLAHRPAGWPWVLHHVPPDKCVSLYNRYIIYLQLNWMKVHCTSQGTHTAISRPNICMRFAALVLPCWVCLDMESLFVDFERAFLQLSKQLLHLLNILLKAVRAAASIMPCGK